MLNRRIAEVTRLPVIGCFHFFAESDFSSAASWPRSTSPTTRCPTTERRNSAQRREVSDTASSSVVWAWPEFDGLAPPLGLSPMVADREPPPTLIFVSRLRRCMSFVVLGADCRPLDTIATMIRRQHHAGRSRSQRSQTQLVGSKLA